MLSKLCDLEAVIDLYLPDVIGISETWLTSIPDGLISLICLICFKFFIQIDLLIEVVGFAY